jgi:hypothetical protein
LARSKAQAGLKASAKMLYSITDGVT